MALPWSPSQLLWPGRLGFQLGTSWNPMRYHVGVMKTTVDIPEKALAEAMRHSGATTKKEAIVTAIADYNRRQRLAKLVARFGTFEGVMSQKELRRMRENVHRL